MKRNILVLLLVAVYALIGCSSSSIVKEEAEAYEERSYSAQEVMTFIDELRVRYTNNKPEHIKALVIAANLDYIEAEDLDIILKEYDYEMEDLAVLYDECILDNAASFQISYEYTQGQVETMDWDNIYAERIDLGAVALNDEDEKTAKKMYDNILVHYATGHLSEGEVAEFRNNLNSCSEDMSSFERTCYSYTWGVLYNELTYTKYLDNPYINYMNSEADK